MTHQRIILCQPKDYSDRIKFYDTIILDQARKKFEQNIHYSINKWKEKGYFGILTISLNM